MSEQVWSEWIEHKPGACPIPWAGTGKYQVEWRKDRKRADSEGWCRHMTADGLAGWEEGDVTAYRYRLDYAPAGFVPPGAEKPWVPPVPEGFGPWVEYDGAARFQLTCRAAVLYRHEREAEALSGPLQILPPGNGYIGSTAVVAIALERLADQPTQEQVEATQKPETPEADASEDAKAANRPMFDADDVGVSAGKWDRFNARLAAPTAAPGFMVRDVRSSDGLLTVRGSDHRLGLWE